MGNIITLYLGDLKTRVRHVLSGQELITDAPPDNNGKGENFSPTDLVAAALGSCMLTVIGIICQRNGINIEGTGVTITKLMGDNPRRISGITVDFSFPPIHYTDKEKSLIEATARACPVAKSLHPELTQTLNFYYK